MRVLFFGGNGHAAVRLERARVALAEQDPQVECIEVQYPGFEGRPPVTTWEAFRTEVQRFCAAQPHVDGAYATGIGALIAFAVRAEGGLRCPLVLQSPVLWGLSERRFPALMRIAPIRDLVAWSLRRPAFQKRFVGRYFRFPVDNGFRRAFFEGYASCPSFKQLFLWLSPDRLRELERRFAAQTDLLDGITVWWCTLDRVVSLDEVRVTETALGVCWPIVEFPRWGHYPMIDSPEEWAQALAHALASAQ